MFAVEVPFCFFQPQKINPRSIKCFLFTTGILFGKPKLCRPSTRPQGCCPVCRAKRRPQAQHSYLEPHHIHQGRRGHRSPTRSPPKSHPGAHSLPRQHPCHGTLPEAKLQPVLDGARVFPRWGWGNLRFWRRWRRLLFGEGDGEGELGGLGLPKAGEEMCGDVLGPGTGAAAPLGFAPLVECHVPLPPRARAAVDGRGVGVVAVLLESLPKLAIRREPGLQGQSRGHC